MGRGIDTYRNTAVVKFRGFAVRLAEGYRRLLRIDKDVYIYLRLFSGAADTFCGFFAGARTRLDSNGRRRGYPCLAPHAPAHGVDVGFYHEMSANSCPVGELRSSCSPHEVCFRVIVSRSRSSTSGLPGALIVLPAPALREPLREPASIPFSTGLTPPANGCNPGSLRWRVIRTSSFLHSYEKIGDSNQRVRRLLMIKATSAANSNSDVEAGYMAPWILLSSCIAVQSVAS